VVYELRHRRLPDETRQSRASYHSTLIETERQEFRRGEAVHFDALDASGYLKFANAWKEKKAKVTLLEIAHPVMFEVESIKTPSRFESEPGVPVSMCT
jgi:hypothetical protein